MYNLNLFNCSNIKELNKYLSSCKIKMTLKGSRIEEQAKFYSINQVIAKANLLFKVKSLQSDETEEIEKLKQHIVLLRDCPQANPIARLWNKIYRYFFVKEVKLETTAIEVSEPYFPTILAPNLFRFADNNARIALAQVNHAFNKASSLHTSLDQHHLYEKIVTFEDLIHYLKLYKGALKKLDLTDLKFSNLSPQDYAQLAKHCPNLEELTLIRGNLKAIAAHFPFLKSLNLNRYRSKIDVAHLKDFKNLKILSYVKGFFEFNLAIENLDKLNDLTQLEEFHWQSLRTNSLNLENIQKLTNLKTIYINNTQVINHECIKQLTALQKITLDSLDSLNDLKFLANLENIQSLELNDGNRADKWLENLSEFKNLFTLHISGWDLNVNLAVLRDNKLKHLKIEELGKEYTQIRGINYFPSIEDLEIITEQIDLEDYNLLINLKKFQLSSLTILNFDHIRRFSLLEELKLDGQHSDLPSLEIIGELKNLKKLTLYDFSNVINLNFINELKNLTHFEAKGCQFLEITELGNVSSLKSLTIKSNQTSFDLTCLSQTTNLNSLKLSYPSLLNLEQLNSLKELSYLKLTVQTGKISIEDFKHCQQLETLSFSGFEDINDIEKLKNFSQLKNLSFNKCINTNINLEYIAEVKNLNFLHLEKCRDIFGWANMKKFNRLRKLNIVGYQLTDQYLKEVVKIASIRFIEIDKTNLISKELIFNIFEKNVKLVMS